jgi:hypothetical protein
MKNRLLLINLLIAVLLTTTWLVKSQITNATNGTNTTSQTNGDRKYLEFVRQLLKTPITFYGKVVDEKGNPIPRAEISYTALDKFWKDGTKYKSVSDDKGLFTLTGIKGGALYVSVEKEGYYVIHQHSAGGFSATMIPTPELTEKIRPPYEGGYDRPLPAKDQPAVFVLRKKGEAEPLIKMEGRYKVLRDGTPMEISLRKNNPKGVLRGQGDIIFERWSNDSAVRKGDSFDWRCRISVLGGGLIERKDEFNFEAPLEGYQPSIEINMPASLGEKWQYSQKLDYFLKLKDGNFARAKVELYGGHDNFLAIESYLNPSGSRNLEYDKTKKLPGSD